MSEELSYSELEQRLKKLEATINILKADENRATPMGILATLKDMFQRKRSEESLKQEHGFKDRLIQNSPAGITHINDSGLILYANKRAEQILGFEISDDEKRVYNDAGWKITDFNGSPVPDENLPFFIVKRTGEPVFNIQIAIKRPDDGKAFLSVNAAPLISPEGLFEGMIAVFDDVTDRVKIDRALRQSEDRFSGMFEHMGSGVAVYEAVDGGNDFLFKAFNSAAEQITRIPREQVLGHRFFELFPQMVESDLPSALYRVWKTGNAEYLPPFYYKDKTREGWRENRVFKLPSNEIVAIFDDVTDRKHAEERLIESEERMQIILDSIPDRVLQIDLEMRVLWANKAYLALNQNPIGQICFNAFPGSMSLCEGCSCSKSLKTGKVESGVLYQPDSKTAGESYWENISVPLKNKSNQVTGAIGILRNITDRMQAEKKERQIHKAESLNRMAGAIAHRFNNQLYVVMGNLEMALEDLPADSLQRQNLTEALRAAKRSAETSGFMLTYLGQSVINGEPIDLSHVCRQNLPLFQSAISHGIVFETNFMDSGPIIQASSTQMEEILTRLITNAVEAIGDSDGKIVLATGVMSAEDMPKLNLTPPNWKPDRENYAWLYVTDSGCGISKVNLDRLFDPFFSTKMTGRGLGLPVILGIVRQLNGALSVESREGYGSIFRVFFPLIDDGTLPALENDTFFQPVQKADSVLLTDDEEMVRTMAEKMLNHLGHSVILASSGAEAIDLFSRERDKIGCVITDLTMPGMDGWEMIAALRHMDGEIPIVLFSGYDKAEVMSCEQSERPNVFLHKPFTLSDLKAALAAVGKE